MDRIKDKLIWLGSPAFADELIGRQPTERLQSAGVGLGVDEICEVLMKLAVVIVMKAFDGDLLDRAILLAGKRFLESAGTFVRLVCSFKDASPL
jgi:hypothetical protein